MTGSKLTKQFRVVISTPEMVEPICVMFVQADTVKGARIKALAHLKLECETTSRWPATAIKLS